jgi:hypothetical protein
VPLDHEALMLARAGRLHRLVEGTADGDLLARVCDDWPEVLAEEGLT